MDKERNDFLWRQFCKLGEMMGDGLHYEQDGKWIAKEYRELAKILLPPNDEYKRLSTLRRKQKNESVDSKMVELTKIKCECGGTLKQARSGSKVAYCIDCKSRYKATVKKKV
jgi:hypothetical protein